MPVNDVMEEARAFTAAAGAMLWIEASRPRLPGAPTVMFQWLGRGDRAGLDLVVDAAIREASDAVVLEFEPGRECMGPVNIDVVIRSSEVAVVIFPQCTLWTGDDGGTLLVLSGLDFSFAFDGHDLVLTDAPPADDLEAGLARAWKRLRIYAARARVIGPKPPYATERPSRAYRTTSSK